ncbi:MAG: PAS domain-containing sensor histidine kinase [bacterium]|nr:PAS domain-containing sensor histidine kinase [bacterium]
MAVLQNITDRKQIEEDLENARTAAKNVFEDLQVEKEALDNTKAKDEAILSGIGEGLVAVDKEGNILFISKAFEALTGWGEKEIAGKRMVEVVPQEDEAGNLVPPQERAITQALVGTTTTSSSSSSWYYIRKDKTRFPASGIVTPVTLDGKIIGAVEVFRDITKEKEIDRMKTEFLALASHQLRTPLSGIKWFVETLDRKILGTVNQKQQEYLDQIYQLNERALKIVFDMLNALRIEGGDVAMKTEAISLARLARDVSLATAPVAEQRGVRLHADVKNLATTVVETDAEMLRSILETFIVNAINYSERGQDIFFDVTEETGSVVFSVKDSGIGIPNDEQGRIFEKFYRASNAKKFKPDGTGLGLYVASMLAEKIGAKILLESEPGKGSIFYLRVPKLKSTT